MYSLLRRDIQYKDFDDFDDLVISVCALENIVKGYERKGIDVPEWLSEKVRDGNAELKYRQRAQKERKLHELRMQQDQLMTRSEKRTKVDEEIDQLEKELSS